MLLQFLIGIIDAQLLKAVILKTLKAINVEDGYRFTCGWCCNVLVDHVHQPAEQPEQEDNTSYTPILYFSYPQKQYLSKPSIYILYMAMAGFYCVISSSY